MSHLFLSTNLIDNSDLSYLVGTELAQFPILNIKDQFSTKVARVEANTVEILIDTKVLTPKDIIMLVGSSVNGIGFTAVSAYSSTTTDFSSSTEQVIPVSAEYNMAYLRFTATNNRYWKLVFTGTGSTTEISKIFLGQADTLESQGFSQDSFRYGFIDNSDIASNKYGNRFSTEYTKLKKLSGTFKVIQVNDLESIEQIASEKGLTKPLFIIIDPDSNLGINANLRFSGYVYFESIPEFSTITTSLFSVSLSFIQAG